MLERRHRTTHISAHPPTHSLALVHSPTHCFSPRPPSSGSVSGPSSRRPSTADTQEGDSQQRVNPNLNSKHKTKSQPKSQPKSRPKIQSKPKSDPKGARESDSAPSAAVPMAQSELRLYYTKKKKVLAILVRAGLEGQCVERERERKRTTRCTRHMLVHPRGRSGRMERRWPSGRTTKLSVTTGLVVACDRVHKTTSTTHTTNTHAH